MPNQNIVVLHKTDRLAESKRTAESQWLFPRTFWLNPNARLNPNGFSLDPFVYSKERPHITGQLKVGESSLCSTLPSMFWPFPLTPLFSLFNLTTLLS